MNNLAGQIQITWWIVFGIVMAIYPLWRGFRSYLAAHRQAWQHGVSRCALILNLILIIVFYGFLCVAAFYLIWLIFLG